MTETRAETSMGAYVGIESEGLRTFRGIPYAEPPVGPLRLALPQKLTARFDRRLATEHGPVAPQLPSRLSAVMGDFTRTSDEDCLTLTVWAPVDARDLPVLVWIHGGAWMTGAGSLDWYDGSHLAREGKMVVVGVNYRLGALGYLFYPGVSPGNLGTADVGAALGWVQEEIAAFGGDPARVTVGGQSAGAFTIGRLIGDPAMRKLFRRAIVQSGGFGRTPLSGPVAARRALILADELGIDLTVADAPAQLREVPVPDMLRAQSAVARAIAGFADTTAPFTPMQEGEGSAGSLIENMAAGANGLDLLIGATRDEAHAFFAANPALDDPDRSRIAERAAQLTGEDHALERYAVRRPGGSLRDLISDITTDCVFRHPALRLAEAVWQQGGRAFAYQFDWSPPGSRFHACHCIELPFVFGTFDAYADAPMLAGGNAGEMHALSDLIRRQWAAFVHTGVPANPDLLPWTPYEPRQRSTMVFGRKVGRVGDPGNLERGLGR